MKKNNHGSEKFSSIGCTNIQDSAHNVSVTDFLKTYNLFHFLHFIGGACQILLGLAIVTLSVLGYFKPFWLSTGLNLLAGIATIIGLYVMYITALKKYDRNSLLRNAMRRVMESKN